MVGELVVVGKQRLARGAVLAFRGGRRRPGGGGIEDPDRGRVFQQARGLVEIGIGLARAAGAADLIGHVDGKAAQRLDDADLEVRHVVEGGARIEEGIVRGPAVLIDLAVDQPRGGCDRVTGAVIHRAGIEVRIVIDLADPDHAHGVVEQQQRRATRMMQRTAKSRSAGACAAACGSTVAAEALADRRAASIHIRRAPGQRLAWQGSSGAVPLATAQGSAAA